MVNAGFKTSYQLEFNKFPAKRETITSFFFLFLFILNFVIYKYNEEKKKKKKKQKV
jgi:hypothetical protein